MENYVKRTNLSIRKNLKTQALPIPSDYDKYKFSYKEFLVYLIEGLGIVVLFSYVFYRSVYAVIFMSPLAIGFLIIKNRDAVRKRKEELMIGFGEMMGSVTAALQAGYSVENSFAIAAKDMNLIFGQKSCITKETEILVQLIRNNITVEDGIEDLARRSKVSDIREFAEVFRIAKRSGGDMTKMIKNTGEIISEKIDVKRRINTLIGAKKLESTIMNMVPFGIILYINASNPGFYDPLYEGIMGRLIMTVLIFIYLIAYALSMKIVNIEID